MSIHDSWRWDTTTTTANTRTTNTYARKGKLTWSHTPVARRKRVATLLCSEPRSSWRVQFSGTRLHPLNTLLKARLRETSRLVT